MKIKQPIFKTLPSELENYILELNGGLLHRKKMNILKKDLHIQGVCNYLGYIPAFEMYDSITFEESVEYINLLTNCSCCLEHQKKRPTTKMFLEGYVPEYPTKRFLQKKCRCRCRQTIRLLCREYNDIVDDFEDDFDH